MVKEDPYKKQFFFSYRGSPPYVVGFADQLVGLCYVLSDPTPDNFGDGFPIVKPEFGSDIPRRSDFPRGIVPRMSSIFITWLVIEGPRIHYSSSFLNSIPYSFIVCWDSQPGLVASCWVNPV